MGPSCMEEKKEKFVSIIIPVYQAKDTLKTCVLSCLNQKYLERDEFEVILVDDESTDGSGELCDELLRQYGEETIKVRHIKNIGVSHARNVGLGMAEGRFVTFVDADDCVSDSLIENMMKHADESTALVDETDVYAPAVKITGFQYIENVILAGNSHVWAKLYDRKTLCDSRVKFNENLTIGEDLLFLVEFALYLEKRHSIVCIPEGDYKYTVNPTGAMYSSFKESYMDQFVCWKMAEDRLKGHRTEISEYAFVNLAVSQIMAALLVVGKVAVLDEQGRDRIITDLAVSEAGKQISHALKRRGAFAGLSFGYKLKVMLFRLSPALYLKLDHRHKRG